MNQGFDLYMILLFAAAAFIVYRLWGVLGRHDDDDSALLRRDAVSKSNQNGPVAESEIIDLPLQRNDPPPISSPDSLIADDARLGIEKISQRDPQFSPEPFLNGASSVYEQVTHEFSYGEIESIKFLLSQEVFEQFKSEIDRRKDNHESFEWKLISIDDCKIVEANLIHDHIAVITIALNAQIISAARDGEGRVLRGDPTRPAQIRDLWTFERDLTSSSPNWLLIATETATT